MALHQRKRVMRISIIILLIISAMPIAIPASADSTPFPSVSSISSGFTTSSATHVLYLPGSAVKGDLLIACVDSNVVMTMTWPSGWNPLFSPGQAPAGVQMECRFRMDDLSTSFITVTFSSPGADAHAIYRITSWNNQTSPTAAIPVGGTSANPDPPSVTGTPTENRLYLIVVGWWVASLSSYPANYASNQVVANQGANAYIMMASRNLNGGAEDPGTATIGSSNPWIASTVTVRPAQAAVTTNYTPLWVTLAIFAFLVVIGLRLPFVHALAGLLGFFLSYQLYSDLGSIELLGVIMVLSIGLFMEGILRRV